MLLDILLSSTAKTFHKGQRSELRLLFHFYGPIQRLFKVSVYPLLGLAISLLCTPLWSLSLPSAQTGWAPCLARLRSPVFYVDGGGNDRTEDGEIGLTWITHTHTCMMPVKFIAGERIQSNVVFAVKIFKS